jgi:RNA polymerase sigma factor (sigma-70 family)
MSDDPSFDDLLARARDGDEAAATELVRRFEPEVRRFIRYRLTDPRLRRFLDSLDVCQSAFANFFVRLADGGFDLKTPGQLHRLLLTIAGNKVRDHVRRQAAQRRGGPDRAEAGAGPLAAVADSDPGPGESALVRDLIAVFRDRLSAEERGWLDRWLLGRSWQEVAAETGDSTEALRKRFARAVDRAARELGWETEA